MPEESIKQTETASSGGVLGHPIGSDDQKNIERLVGGYKWSRTNMKNVVRVIEIPTFAIDATVTTGDGKQIYNVPEELDGTLIIAAHAFLTTVSSSGAVTVQVRNITDSVDVLSTAITIDASEFDSYTAATAPVINFTNAQLAKSDRIAVDVDGAGTGAQGLTVKLTVQ